MASSRSGTVASGTSTAPGTWAAVYSSGSRTSMTGAPSARRLTSSVTSISGTSMSSQASGRGPSASAPRQIVGRVGVRQERGVDPLHVDGDQASDRDRVPDRSFARLESGGGGGPGPSPPPRDRVPHPSVLSGGG